MIFFYMESLLDRLQPILVSRLVLNIKWAAYRKEHGATIQTLPSLLFEQQEPSTSSRINAIIGEIGGPLVLPGDDASVNDADFYNDDAGDPTLQDAQVSEDP